MQQKYGSLGESYESHGLQRNRTKVFQEAYTTRSFINRKHQATSHVMRREKLEHLVTTGMIEQKGR